MKARMFAIVCIASIAMGTVGCQSDQEKKSISKATAIGAGGGALLGLAMGATTGDGAGKRHLDDFIGQWAVDNWVLDGNGNKMTGGAEAKGVLER